MRKRDFSAFGPVPIFTLSFAHLLEFLNIVPKRIAIVLGPVIAPTSILLKPVANDLGPGKFILLRCVGVFATVGVISAGLGKSEEEEEDERSLHCDKMTARGNVKGCF